MNRIAWLLTFLVAALLSSPPAMAQSIDDLELRKRRAQQTKLGFGMLGVLETSAGLNRERPEASTLLFLAPQLKIGDRMRLRLNMGLFGNWLQRQENPWDFTDFSLQFSHLGIYKEARTGVLFSGYGRYYIPTSKASRNATSYGQLRLVGKASRAFGPLFLALELNGQKYFHEHTTWDTDESEDWLHGAGREDFIQNNASFGFGQTLTASFAAIKGLDLSLIYSLYQARQYPSEQRLTRWMHSFRFVADATLGLGALPWGGGSWLKEEVLARTYVSLGYYILAPQLQYGQRDLNPFNPRYGRAYLDLMVVY